MIVFLSPWDTCVTYLSEILMFLFIILFLMYPTGLGSCISIGFKKFFPWTFSVTFCLSVWASESRVQPACGLLWAMCPVYLSTSWSLSIAQGHYRYPCGQRSNRTTEVLPYPVSGRHLCLYVCGGMVSPNSAMILHSTDHTLVLEGKGSNSLY